MTDQQFLIVQKIVESYPTMLVLCVIMFQVWRFLTVVLYADVKESLRVLIAWFEAQVESSKALEERLRKLEYSDRE